MGYSFRTLETFVEIVKNNFFYILAYGVIIYSLLNWLIKETVLVATTSSSSRQRQHSASFSASDPPPPSSSPAFGNAGVAAPTRELSPVG